MFSPLDPPKNYKITIITWTKDAHALFDYESDSINSICVSLGRGGKIYRDEKKNESKYEKDSEDNGFFLTGSNSASSSNDCLVNLYNEYGTPKNIANGSKIKIITTNGFVLFILVLLFTKSHTLYSYLT